MNVRLYVLQRATAALMVPLIAGHLLVILYATRNGLSAAEILGLSRQSLYSKLHRYGLGNLVDSLDE